MADSSGRRVCALHHLPLTTAKAYVYDGFFSEVEAYARIRARYPNPWQAGFSPTQVAGLPMRPTTLTYCRRCHEAFEVAVARQR